MENISGKEKKKRREKRRYTRHATKPTILHTWVNN